METIADPEKTKNEVLRKIGRNMLLFQEVEHMLKFIIANGKVEGYVSEIKANHEKLAASVQKQTLGILVGKFIENTHCGSDENTEGPQDLKEGYISFSFRVEADEAYYESKMQSLASIVDDRNDLIHHLLPRLNNSIESWLETEKYLDQQHEKLLPEINALKSLIDHFHESKKIHFAFLNSDEGQKQFELLFLKQSRLVILLCNIPKHAARHDGWTLLSTAGQLAWQHIPEEMAMLNDIYGHKTLKGVILASELFDITEEPTDKGGFRLLYRLKDDFHR